MFRIWNKSYNTESFDSKNVLGIFIKIIEQNELKNVFKLTV